MGHLWSWFRGIKGKLLLAAVFSLVGFAALGTISVFGTRTILTQLRSSHKEIIPNLQNLAELRRSRAVFGYQSYTSINYFEHNHPIETSAKASAEAIQHYKDALEAYQKTPFMAEEISATSGEISSLAVTTQNLTDELTLVIHGASSQGHGPIVNEVRHETKKKTKAVTSPKPAAKVIPLVKKAAPAANHSAANMIPFDDEEPRSKVGTTDGF